MEKNDRFKIDFRRSSVFAIGLFFKKPKLFGFEWKELESFQSIAEAKAHYELIKNLPEYLP